MENYLLVFNQVFKLLEAKMDKQPLASSRLIKKYYICTYITTQYKIFIL